jgi:EmrB/QacA subfamily drug resistance transporter
MSVARSRAASSPSLVMAVVCLGIFLAALDQTVIYGALPKMMTDINLPITQLDQAAWIVIGYLLGYTFAMPLLGRISDVYGHSRIYILSLGIFMLGSILAAMAGSLDWMVGARVVQAIGGGALVPVAMAIASDIFTDRRRALAIGVIGAVVEAGGALGPIYGASLAQYWSWRWIFWINLPFSCAAALVVFFFLKTAAGCGGKVDYWGGVCLAAALALLSLGISQQRDQANFALVLGLCLAGSLIFFVLFFWRSRRVAYPLIGLTLFRAKTFLFSNFLNLLVGAALIIALVNVPLITDTIMGKTALEGGLRLLRLTVMLSLGAIAGGYLCRKFDYRIPTIMGLLLSGLGFFFLARWSLSVAEPQLSIDLALCGLGFGLVIAPLATAAIDSAGEEHKGIASSLIVMMRMIGMIVGLAAITSWGMGRFHLLTATLSLNEILSLPDELVKSLLALFHDFFLAAMVICWLAILPALWIKGKNN